MILGKNYKKDNFRRKILESLYVEEKPSSLNTQKNFAPLKLFTWVGNLAENN